MIFDNSRTPLHYAALYESKNGASFLIEKGADVTIRDFNNNTALELVSDSKSNAPLIKLLNDAQQRQMKENQPTRVVWVCFI